MEEIRKREAATSRYMPTRSTESRASSPSDSESTPSVMEVTDGNDGALVAGIALAATMQSFVCTPKTSHVGINMAYSSAQESAHLTKQKGAGSRGEIKVVGLTRVCFQLNCCFDSQNSYSYNMLFPSRPRFPVKHSVACKYNTCYVTNCSTEVGEQPILVFCSLWKRAVSLPKACWGYTAGVCGHKHVYAYPSVSCPKSYRPLYFFDQLFCIEYASMTTLFQFQFPESHKIIFCWDADVRPKFEIRPISAFKNFEFPAP